MAKIQIVFAMTIDGYFPDDDRLMEWIREDRNGFLSGNSTAHFP
mgnify:CR=1 FL=1